MKTISLKKSIVILFTILLSTMVGFAQNDERAEAAKEAATSLTNSMADILGLTTDQIDSVKQYNLSYSLALFTTVPLTEDDIAKFDNTLDANLKEVLSDEQYLLWGENRDTLLNAVKSKIPLEEGLLIE